MELIDLLTKNLGINETQAKGGAGLLFQQAKRILGSADFAKVSSAVPGIEGIMSAAPSSEGGALGEIESIFSGLGGAGVKLSSLANLAGGFSKLGLNEGMISKFIPVILSFVESKGGSAVKGLLEKAIK